MFDKIFQIYIKAAKGSILTVLFLSYLACVAFILHWADSKLKNFSGGAGPIDLLFSYSAEQVYSMLKAYGGQGREFYMIIELTIGTLFPLIYSSLFSLFIIYLCRKLAVYEKVAKFLFLIPPVAMLFDFLENACIQMMLLNYPYKLISIADTANGFTMAKWIFITASIVLTFIGICLWLIRYIRFRFFTKKVLSR